MANQVNLASLGLLNLAANDGTMERWLDVHSGVQQKPQVFEGGGIGNMFKNWWRGKLWQTW